MTNQEQVRIKLKGKWAAINCRCSTGDKPLPHQRKCYRFYQDYEVEATKVFTRIDSLMTNHTGYRFSADGFKYQVVDKNNPNIEVVT